jgi:hypothetical protein
MEGSFKTTLCMPRYTVTYELSKTQFDLQPCRHVFKSTSFDTTVQDFVSNDSDPELLTKQRQHFLENRGLLSKLVKDHLIKQEHSKALAAARSQEALKKWQARVAKIELFRAAGATQEKQRKMDLMFNKYQYAFDPNRFYMQKATLHPRELGVKVPRAFVPVKDPWAEHEAYKK